MGYRIESSGEGRSVSYIQVCQVVYGQSAVNSSYQDIQTLVYLACSEGLGSQHFSGPPVRHQFYHDHSALGHEVRLVGVNDGHGNGIETVITGLLFRKPCLSYRVLEQFHYGRTLDTFEACPLACDIVGYDPSLAVGRGAHGLPAGLTGNDVSSYGTVSSGVYIGIAGAHVGIHSYGTEITHLEAGFLCEDGIGSYADSHKDHICLKLTFISLYSGNVTFLSKDFNHFFAAVEVYSLTLQYTIHPVSKFLIHKGG